MGEEWYDWHWQIENSFAGEEGLRQLSKKGIVLESGAGRVIKEYPFLVTPYYASLIGSSGKSPVGIQSMPANSELGDKEFLPDPFSEKENMPVGGLIHRFPDRVLVLATTKCAVNCRHCTRKNWISTCGSHAPDIENIRKYIKADSRIREVLVSGGDPLLLETSELEKILKEISTIPHVRVMRLGTRVPVVLPMRVDDALCSMLKKYRPLWLNTQFNHPDELTQDALEACRRIIDSGIPVSNQSVLLKDVNDSVEVCEELFSRLQESMIRPYYMFLCDPVKGTAGLRTDLATGKHIEEELQGRLGGLAMPKFVADISGENGKVQLRDL